MQMRPPRSNRYLEYVFIAIVIMIFVMTVLLVAVYLYQSNRGRIPNFSADPTETSTHSPPQDLENSSELANTPYINADPDAGSTYPTHSNPDPLQNSGCLGG
jgi:hypothetical protein